MFAFLVLGGTGWQPCSSKLKLVLPSILYCPLCIVFLCVLRLKSLRTREPLQTADWEPLNNIVKIDNYQVSVHLQIGWQSSVNNP